MRHRVETARLNRQNSHRKATLKSLARSLLEKNRIRTTLPKAHEASRLMDHLIQLGKRGDLAAHRAVAGYLGDRELVHRLFSTVAPLFKNRNGGYTRIVKLVSRQGDRAPMALLELVEFPMDESKEKVSGKAEKEPATVKEKEIAKEETSSEEGGKSFLSGLKKFFQKK